MQTKIQSANLMDKLRSFFGFGDRPKNNNGLPPKKRFSIWYFLMAILFFSYLQQFRFFFKSGDDFL
jgi:cell division protease FtsH